VVQSATILHDIGLASGVSGSNRCEVTGAAAAGDVVSSQRRFLESPRQLPLEPRALNRPSIALHKEAEVALGTMASGFDYAVWASS